MSDLNTRQIAASELEQMAHDDAAAMDAIEAVACFFVAVLLALMAYLTIIVS